MRAKSFIGLIIVAMLGAGSAPISAGTAPEIQGYWKPLKPIKLAIMGSFGVSKDAREVPFEAQNPDDIAYNNAFDSIKKKKFGKAISEFDRLLKNNSRYLDAYYGRGLAYAMQGKYDLAIADFTRYLEFEQKDADSYYNRGLARILQGKYDQGLTDINKALKLSPSDYWAFYIRGFVYFKKGRVAKAKADYERALRLNPELGEREGKG